MRILAIESSAVTASVAILTDDVLTAEYTVNYKKTHSQTLLPMIDEICKMTETEPESFDLIAVYRTGSLKAATVFICCFTFNFMPIGVYTVKKSPKKPIISV